MSPKAHWYLFPREPDLRAALSQESTALLHPYQLWRIHTPPHANSALLLRTEQPLSSTPFATAVSVLPPTPAPNETLLTLTHTTPPSPPQTVEAALWRQGSCLLAALGMQEARSTDQLQTLAWILYDLPAQMLQELVSDHLALDNHDLRCTYTPTQRAWLWSRRAESFLTLKYSARPNVRLYQSFQDAPQILTPLGQRGPFAPSLPQGEHLLVLEADGTTRSLQTSEWWAASEHLHIQDIPTPQPTSAFDPPPPIRLALRYIHIEPRDIPLLWLLEGEPAHPAIESLFFELGIEERRAVSLAITHLPETTQPLFFLRDDRPTPTSPLFHADQAIGFVPFLPQEGFYIQHAFRLYPSLPPNVLKNTFRLHYGRYTILQPKAHTPQPRLLCVPRESFQPIETYLHYQIGAHPEEVRQLAQHTALDILFEPTFLPAPSATRPATATPPPQPEAPPAPSRAQASADLDPAPLAPTRRSEQENALQKLEQRLRERTRRGEHPTTHEWIELARLYYREYIQKQNQLALQEALKAIDQVLYLDRCAPDAVQLERAILEETLRTIGLSFSEQMRSLDAHLQSKEPLRMRLAFRLRARLLLEQSDSPEDQRIALRLHFYRDFAAIEDSLMIREHYIYAEGVALTLQDDELYERARLRYRQALQDQARLQHELPLVLLP